MFLPPRTYLAQSATVLWHLCKNGRKSGRKSDRKSDLCRICVAWRRKTEKTASILKRLMSNAASPAAIHGRILLHMASYWPVRAVLSDQDLVLAGYDLGLRAWPTGWGPKRLESDRCTGGQVEKCANFVAILSKKKKKQQCER